MANEKQGSFVLDIKKIRDQARAHIMDGAVTPENTTDHSKVIDVLNEALATEMVCVLRYKAHYIAAKGARGKIVAEEFLEHAGEEQQHADMIMERIDQLGGKPKLNPAGFTALSHSEYTESDDLKTMLKEDLIAERIAIETYSEIIRWLADKDPTTRRMMETILEKEEEHADDLQKLLDGN